MKGGGGGWRSSHGEADLNRADDALHPGLLASWLRSRLQLLRHWPRRNLTVSVKRCAVLNFAVLNPFVHSASRHSCLKLKFSAQGLIEPSLQSRISRSTLGMMGRWSGMVLAALAAACLTQSVAEADDESHCAMQVGIRRKPVSDFGDDISSAPTEAGFESESPIPEESPAEEPAAEEAAAEESADEESADEEPVAEEETTTEESEQDPAVKQSSAAGVYSDAPVLVGAKKKSGGHAGKSGGSSGGHAGKSGGSSGGHAGHGTWAQAHKKGSSGSALGKEASGKFASEKAEKSTPKAGKWAGKWAGKSTHGKDWKSAQGAGDSDFTTVMIDRFLNKKAPPKNEAVSEHAPLVFMHQHRAGGTTMRKLLYNMSVNMNLKPHIMCSGGVSCREFKNKDDKAAVYGGQFCWRELMESLPETR